MYCTKCGRENNDEAQFCQGCGAALQTLGQQQSKEVKTEEHKQKLLPWKKSPKLFWATIIIGGIMIISAFMPWASEHSWLGSYSRGLGSGPKFLIFLLGSASIGLSFLDKIRARGIFHLIIGIACLSIVAFMATGFITKWNETSVSGSFSPDFGLFLFGMMAVGIFIVGIIELLRRKQLG